MDRDRHAPAAQEPFGRLVVGRVHPEDEDVLVLEGVHDRAVQPAQVAGDHRDPPDPRRHDTQQLGDVGAPADHADPRRPRQGPRQAHLPPRGDRRDQRLGHRPCSEPARGAGTSVVREPWSTAAMRSPTRSAGTTTCTAVRPTPAPRPELAAGTWSTTAPASSRSGSR
ncbi:hypothetical protein [Ornithinimicrobium kibberense]|uniref:hypothetical protein n=1 Tax=Ornithinimicrobium kibberense TaxID=282060 RepID=UPI003605F166